MKTKKNKSTKQDIAASSTKGLSARQVCIDAADSDEPLLFIDGHDSAIIGVTESGGETLVVYDTEKILRRLRKRDGMSKDEALEFFAYNITGTRMGAQTPIFVTALER